MQAGEPELCPIDIVVIGFPPGAPMTGEAIPILLDLVDRGIVRVLDAMIVIKDDDGNVTGHDPADVDAERGGSLTAFVGAASGLLSAEDVEKVAGVLDPGWVAAIIVYENRWAAPFIAAVRRNGGGPDRHRARSCAGSARRHTSRRCGGLTEGGSDHAWTASRDRTNGGRGRDLHGRVEPGQPPSVQQMG